MLTPAEMKSSCVGVSDIEERDGVTSKIDWVYDSRFPEMRPFERGNALRGPEVL
jgi:hypothetical protein